MDSLFGLQIMKEIFEYIYLKITCYTVIVDVHGQENLCVKRELYFLPSVHEHNED